MRWILWNVLKVLKCIKSFNEIVRGLVFTIPCLPDTPKIHSLGNSKSACKFDLPLVVNFIDIFRALPVCEWTNNLVSWEQPKMEMLQALSEHCLPKRKIKVPFVKINLTIKICILAFIFFSSSLMYGDNITCHSQNENEISVDFIKSFCWTSSSKIIER